MPNTNTVLNSTFDNVESRDTSKVAALDIGSNSFHLVVARIVAGSVQILHRVKQKVRLGDGLGSDNILSKEAMQRGLATLEVIAESLQGFEPECVRVVATHTLRKASNAKEFLKAAKKVFPFPCRRATGCSLLAWRCRVDSMSLCLGAFAPCMAMYLASLHRYSTGWSLLE